jgi:aerobic-type carbon monoxide dehydrogenase small subunit (CoxS/CutS family)
MSEEKGFKKEPGGISRRQFLRDAGIVVGGTAVGSTFFLSACGKEVEVTKTVTTTAPGITKTTTAADNTVTITKYTCPVDGREFDSLEALKAHYDETHEGSAGTAHNTITLTINGDLFKDILVKPHWTLRHLLHQELNFKEVKAMCVGRGQCGSCTVIMDGRPILSCMTLAATCDGAVIETSVGIAAAGHPLIDSYIKHYCMQCGYCTPGFLTTAKALLDRVPNPTKKEIQLALEGNVCRCGTYPAHVPAVLEASGQKGGA